MGVSRRAAIATACLWCALAPSFAYAQEAEPAPAEETPEAETQAAEEADPYEPDQRGVEGESETAPQAPPQERADSETVELQSLAGSYVSSRAGSELGVDLALWLGASLTSLDVGESNNLVREAQEGSFGAAFAFSFAMRMGYVSIGPRVGFQWDPSFVLATIGLDATVRLTPDEIAPYIRASLSGLLLVGLEDSLPRQSQAGIGGIGAEIAGGVRWDVADRFMVGAELSGGWYHLWRGSDPACDAECTDGELDLRERGESDALTLRLSVFAGWWF
jgi:hypothetical protein